jgi:cell division septation protein DedD
MNIFNKKNILFFSISTLMFNGCIAKNEFKTKSVTRVMPSSNLVQRKNVWKQVRPSIIKRKNTNKEDCIDCYATPINASKTPSVTRTSIKVIKTKRYGAYDYTETAADTSVKTNSYTRVNANRYVLPAVSTLNSSYGSYRTYSKSKNTAIQVGAFRKYAGAKIYMKRYNALSNKYKVSIKTGIKNNRPLHRVRIEGFVNKSEAKKFMYRYAIKNAFLVRR